MSSIWQSDTNIKNFDKLKCDLKTDVLIIGGGLAGLLTAYMLTQKGVDCVLLEAGQIAGGVTKNTTAKITFQHGLIYQKLLKTHGKAAAALYLNANKKALDKYQSLSYKIDCDFETKDAFVYTLDNTKPLENELNALKEIGYSAYYQKELPLPFKTAGAVKFKGQAQFNPLKFISGIVENLNIYQNSRVVELVKNKAKTDTGSVTANKIIVCTHFPFINKHGLYFLKMYQHRSYVIALENGPDIGGMYVDDALKGMSFRNYKNYLLIGGGDHRTGKKGGGYNELKSFAKAHYPDLKIKYSWATQDCMTLDGLPYIGNYSKMTDSLYVATGFNKWGMTTSMVAAELLCDMVTGKTNPLSKLLSPSRNMLKPQLAVNGVEAVLNLATFSKKRCPHLGCALKWNAYEHSWDCPCHGSRFTEDGRVINGPANGDLKK
jgi:hypothetical protein